MPGIVTVSLWYTVTIFIGQRHYLVDENLSTKILYSQLHLIGKWNINISKR